MTDEPASDPQPEVTLPEAAVPPPSAEPEPAPSTIEPQPTPPAVEPEPESEPAAAPPPAEAKTAPAKATPPSNAPFVWGTGRRKASVARVRIRLGEGKFLINKRDVEDFFRIDRHRAAAARPLNVTETQKDYDVYVNVGGGGITGQAGAVMLGLARALVKANPDYEAKLREHQLLRRDPRKVERKKYGQRGARRRFQFSKR